MDSEKVSKPTRVTVKDLPREVLSQIFGYLDEGSPLEGKQIRQPPETVVEELLCSTTSEPSSEAASSEATLSEEVSINPLKQVSLACQEWRSVVKPMLFRHIIWRTTKIQKPTHHEGLSPLPFVNFVVEHELAPYVRSVTILLHYDTAKIPKQGEEETRDFGVLPPEGSSVDAGPVCRPGIHRIASDDGDCVPAKVWDNSWLWEAIFNYMDPARITLISNPADILSLISRSLRHHGTIYVVPRWSILSVSRDPKLEAGPLVVCSDDEGPTDRPSPLFTMRAWTHLFLNEGNAFDELDLNYGENHNHLTLLWALMSRNDPWMVPFLMYLQKMSYISVHPDGPVTDVLKQSLPPVKSLYLQFIPKDIQKERKSHHSSHRDFTVDQGPMEGLTLGICCMPMSQITRQVRCSQFQMMATWQHAAQGTCWGNLERYECQLAAPDSNMWEGMGLMGGPMRTAPGRLGGDPRLMHYGDGVFEAPPPNLYAIETEELLQHYQHLGMINPLPSGYAAPVV